MIRYNYLKEEQGIYPPNLPWNSFPWGTYSVHTITEEEALKPYMIPFNAYGEILYTDIILFLNGIPDPSKLKAGDTIRLPDIQELETWLDENK